MPGGYSERYQIEILADRSTVLHDNATGRVIESFAGPTAYLDASDLKNILDNQVSDEKLWEWIK